MTQRAEIINAALGHSQSALNNERTAYLEIGCKVDGTFRLIKADHKVGVDIASGGTVRMSSDDYFAQNTEQFDVIFIDGCHHHDFVMRDFVNATKCLKLGGFILIHDCNPITRDHEKPDGCGTSWRAFIHIRNRPDVDAIVCAFDHGLSVVRLRPNKHQLAVFTSMEDLTYDDLENNRRVWLNVQPYEQIIAWIKQ
jgi:SAM-dependent methyltransferase